MWRYILRKGVEKNEESRISGTYTRGYVVLPEMRQTIPDRTGYGNALYTMWQLVALQLDWL